MLRTFSAWWLVLPLLARAALLVMWARKGVPEATAANIGVGLALGALQDALIGAQALAAWWLVRATGRAVGRPRWGDRASWALLGALGGVYGLWLLVDVLLYANIELRMTASFWHFFLDVGSFWDSAAASGLWLLGGAVGVLGAGLAAWLRRMRRALGGAPRGARALAVGALAVGGRYGVTPRFDALSREGVLFRSFYASGVQTTRAVVALLFGVPSRYSEGAVQADLTPPSLIGLPALFKARGYVTAYLHNGALEFERMGDFMRAHGFDAVAGDTDLLAAAPGAARFSWGVHDEHLMGFVLDWLEAKDQEGTPAFITTFTISNHHPWELPASWSPVNVPVSADETYGKFLRALHYSDAALGALVDGLRARGLSGRTLVIITADTSQAMGDRFQNFKF